MKRSRIIANIILSLMAACVIVQAPMVLSDRAAGIIGTYPLCFPGFVAIGICLYFHLIPGFGRLRKMGGYYSFSYYGCLVVAVLTLVMIAKYFYRFITGSITDAGPVDMALFIGLIPMLILQTFSYIKE